MGLFLVFFWCAAIAQTVLRYDSRFGGFNSRLGPNKFPFGLLRELAGKGLICLAFSRPERHLWGTIEKIPGSTGITRNFVPGEPGGGTTCSGADLRCPRPIVLSPANRRGLATPEATRRARLRLAFDTAGCEFLLQQPDRPKFGAYRRSHIPFFFEAEILSRMRSPVTSRSNRAKDNRTLSVNRPIEIVILNF
jgi:hypothetical protein